MREPGNVGSGVRGGDDSARGPIECVGGPYDGEQRPERGLMWSVVARVRDGEAGQGHRGVYLLRAGRYYWREG